MQKKQSTYFQLFFLFMFMFLSYKGYNYIGFNMEVVKMAYFLLIFCLLIWLFIYCFQHKGRSLYFNPVRNILFSMVFSIIMASLFWDQSIFLGYRATAPLLSMLFFFCLYKMSPSTELIEKFIWFSACIYILLWLYGIFKVPQIVYITPNEQEISLDRGIGRLSLPGRECLTIAFFLAINKYINTKKRIYILALIFLFIFIILQVTRQIIIFSFLVGIYYFFKNNKKMRFYFIIIILMIYFAPSFYNISDDTVVGRLINTSNTELDEQKEGNENIRISEYRYFAFDYSKNLFTTLLGNGVPQPESSYGQYEQYIAKYYAYYLSDVGYANIIVYVGFLGLFLYIILFLKVIKQSVSNDHLYAKMFMIYQIPANIAASWVYIDIIMICVALYILEKDYKNNQ